jgi:hypothetical protein
MVIRNAGDSSAPHLISTGDFELLPHSGAQGPCEVSGMVSGKGCAVGGKLVGDPAAAGHRVKSNRTVAIAMEA